MSISVKNVASKANPIGKYLWKKYEKAYAVVTPIELISRSPVTVKLEITGDIEAVAVDRLSGFTFAIYGSTGMLHNFAILSNGTAECMIKGGSSACTYDPSTQVLTLDDFSITDETSELSEFTQKIINIKDFIGYVVSDNEEQYPDGDEQDGIWYERLSVSKFGFSDFDHGSITIGENQVREITFKHELCERPKLVVIFSNDVDEGAAIYSTGSSAGITFPPSDSISIYLYEHEVNARGNGTTYAYYPFQAGAAYHWWVFA